MPPPLVMSERNKQAAELSQILTECYRNNGYDGNGYVAVITPTVCLLIITDFSLRYYLTTTTARDGGM